MTLDELLVEARRWRDADPDAANRARLDGAIRVADPRELMDLVAASLRFGTAGLRAPLGPGPNRMNRLVVRRAAIAISDQLLAAPAQERGPTIGVVVGHDARHGSTTFAEDVVRLLAARGLRVDRFDEAVPTPLLAGAIRDLDASAGVMITASHNPRSDNGLKLYWSDGAQIIPPLDDLLAARMGAVDLDQVAGERPFRVVDHERVRSHHIGVRGAVGSGEPTVQSYLGRVRDVTALVGSDSAVTTRVAYTALHGVGAELLERVLAALGVHEVTPVAHQREPDPEFPTVETPNPEHPETLEALVRTAHDCGADVALALDPDADRLAVVLPDPSESGRWRPLTGDETGVLLAAQLIEATGSIPDRLVTSTLVSSRLVARVCMAAGVHHVETLTGFKWLCRPAMANPRWYQLLAYEEAMGYAIGPGARDKDGIAAAAVVVALLSELAESGRTAWDVLDDLARRHGLHLSAQSTLELDRSTAPEEVVGRLDVLAGDPPTDLGARIEFVDRPAADVLRLFLDDDSRLVVRPSGTEPKLKLYAEAVQPVGRDITATRAAATARVRAMLLSIRHRLS